MPLLPTPDFTPTYFLRNSHIQTILPTKLRRVHSSNYVRERIETPDNDFFDVDWSCIPNSDNLVVLIHGLESNSNSNYIRGMVHIFNRRGWSVAVMNFRGCSGEINRLYKSYHSGATEDIHTLVTLILQLSEFKKISLVGFSLGGNAVLKYLGEQADNSLIYKAGAVSVPCDLKSSALKMAKSENALYMKRFVRSFQQKLIAKKKLLPKGVSIDSFNSIKTFQKLDDLYTAPAHGFKNAEEYWKKCSSIHFISEIKVPTLLISSKDDSFLDTSCFPIEQAKNNPNFYLEIPNYGGHLGFMKNRNEFWHESRIADFITN